jgi:cytochrome b6-f complex iron-sulfur subunit
MNGRRLEPLEDDATSTNESPTTCADCVAKQLTRRGFVSAATASLVAAALAACGGGGDGGVGPGGGGGGGGSPTTGVTVTGNTVAIDITLATRLAETNGVLFIPEASTVVVNLGNEQFRAFTSVCTHQQGAVNRLENGALQCDSHGSRFNPSTGAVMVGPAELPLRQFTAAFNPGTNTVTVTKS